MSIKILSPIDEAYLSKLNSAKSDAEDTGSLDTSFSDALAAAKEMLDSQELSDAEKNAVRAMTVDAAVDAIQENGGYGLSLDSSLAKSLGLTQNVANTTSQITDSSSVQVETAEEAAARNATSEAAQAAASSLASDDSQNSASESTNTLKASSGTLTSGNVETYSVDSGELSCSDTLNDYFEEASSTYDVDLKLLKCIALVESDFNPDCTSSSGAAGVMQLMPETAKELGVEDSYDAYQNIMGGAKYISQLLEKYDGDIALAAAAYNAGPGAVSQYGGIPPYEETQNYVTKVLSYYNS
jgi:soluble lytic murein transglycosylase-like protein